ncbi:LysR family transcriptional regulator [Salinarimonas ramus]|uniref:LysR family transcriptional regulator n=1 Tax=Salinarimonas ramus TaxID=690164 RepID=A0A917VAD8_9HYPH|nr:LysR family transcriptional regulator [Salinarimonas ramus]GGK54191.1 LysR family transcriptional regulator [Salinarimonas ramus]
MASLNYHHLRYFWTIAHEGGLTRAARRLNVSQSALSVQLKALEEQLGHTLFDRAGKRLELTEAGRIALDYADSVFKTGEELVSTLRERPGASRRTLRVGAIATLSRNFQLALLGPLLGRADLDLVLRSGTLRELLARLDAHELDLVLANAAAPRDAASPRESRLLDEQPVSIVGRSRPEERHWGPGALRVPEDLDGAPMVLPSAESEIRHAFERLCDEARVRPTILAEVDDMAMLRLLARESPGLTLVPPIVVRDELAAGILVEHARMPRLTESFYAITSKRRFPNPLVAELLQGRGGG